MKLLGQVDIINCFRSRHNALMTFFVYKYAIDRIIEVEFVEAGSWLTLQQIGIVIPEI